MEEQQTYDVAVVKKVEPPMRIEDVLAHVNLVQTVMKSVMQKDEHYGIIPGTKKPSLYKPGAEKLSMTFRMAPRYRIKVNDLGNGHREYEVDCDLYSIGSDVFLGSGTGQASTLEGKYRYRTGPTESTGKPVPKEYWNIWKTDPVKAQAILGGPGFTRKKADSGIWEIYLQGEKVEHDNPADYYNTVKKMAKKRAFVDATLTVTAASDIFTQDTEDLAENGVMEAEVVEEKKEPPKQAQKEAKKPEGLNTATGEIEVPGANQEALTPLEEFVEGKDEIGKKLVNDFLKSLIKPGTTQDAIREKANKNIDGFKNKFNEWVGA